ncbi:MAG: M90 family metallopeptidase [Bacteroidota bacterium]
MSETRIIFIIVLLLGLLIVGWYFFFKKERRAPLGPFPKKWRQFLKKKVRFYQQLELPERKRFEKEVQEFLQDCTITGVDLQPTDEDRLLVAASAVIPIFGFADWKRYPNLKEVLLYPSTFSSSNFSTRSGERRTLGMVGRGFMGGKMILSRPALHLGFEQAGKSNVGIHEFVHLIDMMDGATDGIPEYLMQRQYTLPWLDLIHRKIRDIKKRRSDINPYGATSEIEFLAVAAEYFFQRPLSLKKKHPELYEVLEQIFQQDLDDDGDFGHPPNSQKEV